MGEMRETAAVDLSGLAAQLQDLNRRGEIAERRAQRVLELVERGEQGAGRLDRLAGRVRNKILDDYGKDTFRGFGGMLAGEIFLRHGIEDTGGAALISDVGVRTAQGLAFGGMTGGAFAFLTSSVSGLLRAKDELQKEMRDLKKEALENRTSVELAIIRLEGRRSMEERELAMTIQKELIKFKEDLEKSLYQTSQYIE